MGFNNGYGVVYKIGFYRFIGYFSRLEKENCIASANFQHKIIFFSPAKTSGFIVKLFLKFRKFQPRYSYKIYASKKRKWSDSAPQRSF